MVVDTRLVATLLHLSAFLMAQLLSVPPHAPGISNTHMSI